MSRAAMVLTTSLPLYDSRRREHSNVLYTPNGVDTRLFRRALEELTVPCDMTDVCHPIVGYVGNVRWWLDCDLIETVVDAMSDTEFVFIGPISCQQVVDRLNTRTNVRFLGLKPRNSLPTYLRQFDVTLCPFRKDNYFQCARPLKILEYLSAGKPVVTTPLHAISDLADVLYLASSPDETIAALKKALSEASDPELISRRLQRAAENDWDVLTSKTAEAILALCRA
ncbi:MAG: glycosyltransferase [Armatimonadetes bacterium]|nr:glycosyltransferase [Armatimonadota bacterium]